MDTFDLAVLERVRRNHDLSCRSQFAGRPMRTAGVVADAAVGADTGHNEQRIVLRQLVTRRA